MKLLMDSGFSNKKQCSRYYTHDTYEGEQIVTVQGFGDGPREKSQIYFFLILLLTGIIIFGMIFTTELRVRKARFVDLKENEARIVDVEADILSSELKTVIFDLRSLRFLLENALVPQATADDLKHVIGMWQLFGQYKMVYKEVSYINEVGETVFYTTFGDKDGTSYFRDIAESCKKQEACEFYKNNAHDRDWILFSDLELMRDENKILIEPYEPIVHISIPVFDSTGKSSGFVHAKYMLRDLLELFRVGSTSNFSNVALVTGTGDWIIAFDESVEWNYMFTDKIDDKFQTSFPEEWNAIVNGDGQAITTAGLVTSKKFSMVEYLAGIETTKNLKIVTNGGTWYIVSFASRSGAAHGLFIDDKLAIARDIVNRSWVQLILHSLTAFIIAFAVYHHRRRFRRAQFYSQIDPLTSVYNRWAVYEGFEKYLERNLSNPYYVSCCYVDINGLKAVNDNLGHHYGDNLIVSLVNIIKKHLSKADFIIRLGGDEFLVVHPEKDKRQMLPIWDRIMDEIEEVNNSEKNPYIISISRGCAFGMLGVDRSTMQREIDAMIQEGDKNMYEEKARIGSVRVVR